MTKSTKAIEDMSVEELMALVKAKKENAQLEKIENVTMTRKGKTLTIVIEDVTKVVSESKSGKSNMIATTHGFLPLGEGLTLSLNLTTKK